MHSADKQDPAAPDAQVVFEFIFPKVLVKAQVAGERELTVNAYQAFTTGGVDDIASTLQRYRPEITGTYADATQENFIFNWGKTDDSYTVHRPIQTGETPDYTCNDGTEWVTLNSADYTPKGGEYLVTQYFHYQEDGEKKKYPLPMEVHLTVTEVELTGANATGLSGTYRKIEIEDAFKTLGELGLPSRAVLGLSPVPGSFVLTMPISGWTPSALKDMVTTDAVPAPWPAVGKYTLAGPTGEKVAKYVKDQYPWVTVPNTFNSGITATRTVVADDAYSGHRYVATYVNTVNNGTNDGAFILRVAKTDDAGAAKTFDAKVNFTAYLPDGTPVDTVTDLPMVSSIPSTGGAFYYPSKSGDNTYDLTYYPGDTPSAPGGENARRSINLGGWFYISVQEDGGAESELIPVYVPPRTNYYTSSYIQPTDHFNFTGLNAGLYPFYSDSVLPNHVVLPIGYTVATTYDGATGAQPGKLDQFRAASPWSGVATSNNITTPPWPSKDVVTYGAPSDFAAAAYPGFGTVSNTPTNGKQVQMQVQTPEYLPGPDGGAAQPVPDPKDDDKIRLYYADPVPPGISWTGGSPNEVDEVTYTVQTEGYVARQTFTLTIENAGTTDIYGLSIDTDNGVHAPNTDNHFEVLQAPSAYLPVGGKTTFTVTYVYNLLADPGSTGATNTTYRDQLVITGNSHDNAQPLKTFFAQFKVTSQEVYKVTVTVDPADASMGTAGLVEGLGDGLPNVPVETDPKTTPIQATGIANRPDLTGAVSSYAAESKYVWVYPEATDENAVEEVYYMAGSTKVYLYRYEYTKDASVDTDTDMTAYFFEMPSQNVSVVVKFYEPIYAKLRMGTLKAYAGTDADVIAGPPETLIDNMDADKNRQNVRWYENTPNIIKIPMTQPDSSQEKYLVVLGDDAVPPVPVPSGYGNDYDKVQLYLKLRENKIVPDIDPVKVYIQDLSNNAGLVDDSNGFMWIGKTGSPSEHTTPVFDAPLDSADPKAWASKTVRITLSCSVTTATPDCPTATPTTPVKVERSFDVIIVHKGDSTPYTMLYGNSPKGMIYNDSTLTTDAARTAAWDAFKAGSRFAAGKTPAKAAALTNTYWPEAWGSGINYDQNEKAMFVALGLPFQDPGIKDVKNSAGLTVEPKDISRSVEVALLNDAATTQKGRFDGRQTVAGVVDTVVLDLGTADKGRIDDSASGNIDNWWQYKDSAGATQNYAIRPGVYIMKYTFTDYDGATELSLERPFIVLAQVGDVDANRKVEKADAEHIQNRVADPLGGTDNAHFVDWRLFRYRVCDVNNDRNVNNIDANMLFYGSGEIVSYYKPTDYVS